MNSSGIYGLTDEDADKIRYIGRAFDVERRYAQHLTEGRRATREALGCGWIEAPVMRTKTNWLAYMGAEGKPVGVILLESVAKDGELQARREYAWVHSFSILGIPLANGTTAGTHLGGYMDKGRCPYTRDLPMWSAHEITSPDGLLRVRPGYPVIPVLELSTLRKLRTEAERGDERAAELHAEVLAGNLSAHAAMVKAGYRPKTISIPVSRPERVAAYLRKHMPKDALARLVELLTKEE